MSYEAFSEAWAEAWGNELRSSDAYRSAAATWEGSLILEAAADDTHEARRIFADLWHGECRDCRVASDEDHENADYILRASIETWKQVLAGQVDPVFGIMSGKVELARGSLGQLVPQVTAAKELVAAATRIDTVFPAG